MNLKGAKGVQQGCDIVVKTYNINNTDNHVRMIKNSGDHVITVDGRNPKQPPEMYKTM